TVGILAQDAVGRGDPIGERRDQVEGVAAIEREALLKAIAGGRLEGSGELERALCGSDEGDGFARETRGGLVDEFVDEARERRGGLLRFARARGTERLREILLGRVARDVSEGWDRRVAGLGIVGGRHCGE